jgi:hypothetical protein
MQVRLRPPLQPLPLLLVLLLLLLLLLLRRLHRSHHHRPPQVITVLRDAFPAPLWLRPYHILSTGPRSGLIEMVTDTRSLDQLKRRLGFTSLRSHFERHYGPPTSAGFLAAQHNFLTSLAAYSVVCYVLAIKDRHNGNLCASRRLEPQTDEQASAQSGRSRGLGGSHVVVGAGCSTGKATWCTSTLAS